MVNENTCDYSENLRPLSSRRRANTAKRPTIKSETPTTDSVRFKLTEHKKAPMGSSKSKSASPDVSPQNGDLSQTVERQAGLVNFSFHGQSLVIIGVLILVAMVAFYFAKRHLKKRNQVFKANIVSALDMRESWRRSSAAIDTSPRFTEITDTKVAVSELPASCKYLSEI